MYVIITRYPGVAIFTALLTAGYSVSTAYQAVNKYLKEKSIVNKFFNSHNRLTKAKLSDGNLHIGNNREN